MAKFYAGVGSRNTPDDILALMEAVARHLCPAGHVLRSGHAAGADQAFERGAAGKATIYLPWRGFNAAVPVQGEAVTLSEDELAARHDLLVCLGIRRSGRAGRPVRLLHGRNVCQVLGHTPSCPPSSFVVCWCPVVNGAPQGGTATAVLLARANGIPVYNLFDDRVRDRFVSRLDGSSPDASPGSSPTGPD